MKIAQIAPLCEAVPPRWYGGTERVVAHLTEALIDAGFEVTLFASFDSRSRAKLVPCREQALRLDASPLKSENAAHLAMLHEVRRQADGFDILHFHVDLLHYPLFEHLADRTLTTLHGRLDLVDLPALYKCWPQFPLVSISHRQRQPLRGARWFGTVHHGLPPELFRQGAGDGGYLAFLGRISQEKRVDRAIRIAQRVGLPLKIAAKISDADRCYYETQIEPLLDQPGIEFIGEIDDAAKQDFLGRALALLFPIDWPEPFGIVMIEAMACGTPVIGWDCGAVPEVIDDGVSGRIVRSEDDAVRAVEAVARLDRAEVRAAFERRFTAQVMAQNYIELYWRLLRESGKSYRLSA